VNGLGSTDNQTKRKQGNQGKQRNQGMQLILDFVDFFDSFDFLAKTFLTYTPILFGRPVESIKCKAVIACRMIPYDVVCLIA
jgi:hypothetical protein